MEVLISGYGSKNTIARYALSENSHKMNELIEGYSIENPSYLCIYKDLLFTITETDNAATVYMFKLKEDEYILADSAEVMGEILCHITYLPKSKLLIGSCYGDGRVFSIGVADDGFTDVKSSIKLEGNIDSISRAHCAVSDIDEKNLFVTNIATDRVYMCSIQDKKLQVKSYLQLKDGEGPRHIFVNESLKLLYIITEYSNKIITAKINKDNLTQIDSISTLPNGYKGESFGSNFTVSSDGKFVYAANRGANTIASFAIDSDGLLKKIDDTSCFGNWPRHISLIKDKYLYIANRRSDEVVVVKRDENSGLLGEVVDTIKFESPSFAGVRV